jgi:hypothetical protein
MNCRYLCCSMRVDSLGFLVMKPMRSPLVYSYFISLKGVTSIFLLRAMQG